MWSKAPGTGQSSGRTTVVRGLWPGCETHVSLTRVAEGPDAVAQDREARVHDQLEGDHATRK